MKTCKKCGVELNDENWYPAFRKRNVGRCKRCHKKVVDNWEARHPGDQAKRTARWNKRNPDHGPRYYRENAKSYSNRARLRLWKYKTEALNKLGGKCVACGIDDMRVLQINHVNGGGSGENLFGIDMYSAIIKGTRSTADLDVRCANCNIIYEYESGRRSLPTNS